MIKTVFFQIAPHRHSMTVIEFLAPCPSCKLQVQSSFRRFPLLATFACTWIHRMTYSWNTQPLSNLYMISGSTDICPLWYSNRYARTSPCRHWFVYNLIIVKIYCQLPGWLFYLSVEDSTTVRYCPLYMLWPSPWLRLHTARFLSPDRSLSGSDWYILPLPQRLHRLKHK